MTTVLLVIFGNAQYMGPEVVSKEATWAEIEDMPWSPFTACLQ